MSYLDKFNYKIYGQESDKKLVFLHGLMGYGNNWRSVIRPFEKHFQVLTYDQRGHGKSWKPENGYAPEDYAKDLKHILDELDWKKINLVGHSMGARNSNSFAVMYPEYLECLCLEDLGPEANPESIKNNEILLSKVPVPFHSKGEAKETIMRNFSDNETLAQYLYANLEDKEDGTVNWRFSEVAIRESVLKGRNTDRWQDVEAISVPCLLIRGEFSEEFPRNIFEKMLKINSKIEGIEIKNARHWVHYDQKEAFIKALESFLVKHKQMPALS